MKKRLEVRHDKLKRLSLTLLALAMFAAACSGSSDDAAESSTDSADSSAADSTSGATSSVDSGGADLTVSGDMIIQPGACGLDNGEAATGTPIKLGGAATNVPGIDFTWAPAMAKIYFDCVNANGGIHGHPIEYSYEDGAPDPAAWAAIATKLVETDKVLGIVGNMSLVECDVNGDYYAENGYHPIIAGVAPGCFLSSAFSAINMGPYYSNLGAAQAAVRAGTKGKIIVASPNQPGMDFNNTSVQDLAELEGLDFEGFLEDVPIADPAGLAQRLVQAAGEGGGVVLNFTGPTVVPLLQAISEQGLVDSVIWASSTPPNDPSVAQALADCCGSDWDGKFLINAEFNVLDSGLPDNDTMVRLHSEADAEFPISAFSQMGYLIGKFTTEALLRMGPDAEYSVETVNAAFFDLTNAESDMLCKPWYYSSGLDAGNVSNNTDRTVAPQGSTMVEVEGCFDIAATANNPLEAIREAEAG